MSGGSWLPLYMVKDDVPVLLDLLDEKVAFIIADGAGRWRAVRKSYVSLEERIALWHIASGPLPLLAPGNENCDGEIDDPWAGWTERRPGADAHLPYFGPGHPGIIWLNVRIIGRDPSSIYGLSSFEWIGNRYSILGSPANPLTKIWWNRLRRQIAKHGVKVPRTGFARAGVAEIWAFPYALGLLKSGAVADLNP